MNFFDWLRSLFVRAPAPLPGVVINTKVETKVARVRPILLVLGFSEGTAIRDGYNETLSYGAYTGGDVNLVGMTLGEIDKLQTKMLAHPKNHWNSSAVGMFQIVRTTLRKLKKDMRLSDSVKFTAEVQDLMALRLLEGRGLDKWLDGTLSTNAFIDNLAKEWASLPQSNGVGAYKGQGAKAAQFLPMLRNALEQTRDNFN